MKWLKSISALQKAYEKGDLGWIVLAFAAFVTVVVVVVICVAVCRRWRKHPSSRLPKYVLLSLGTIVVIAAITPSLWWPKILEVKRNFEPPDPRNKFTVSDEELRNALEILRINNTTRPAQTLPARLGPISSQDDRYVDEVIGILAKTKPLTVDVGDGKSAPEFLAAWNSRLQKCAVSLRSLPIRDVSKELASAVKRCSDAQLDLGRAYEAIESKLIDAIAAGSRNQIVEATNYLSEPSRRHDVAYAEMWSAMRAHSVSFDDAVRKSNGMP